MSVDLSRALRRPKAVRFPFRGDHMGQAGFLLLLSLLGLSVLAPLLPLGDPAATVGPALQGPSRQWILGTDELGRSLLPRVLEGVRETVVLSSVAVLAATVVGTALACFATYASTRADEVLTRLADLTFSFPIVLIAILTSAVVGPGRTVAMVAIFLVTLPTVIRVVRAEVLRVMDRDFVTAAEISGATTYRVVSRHLLTNVLGVVIVQGAYSLSLGMLLESGISFLGLGVQAPAASLGSLVGGGRIYVSIVPTYMIIPAVVLALAVLAVNLVGEALRARTDPLQGGTS